jgi:hypothetical protein
MQLFHRTTVSEAAGIMKGGFQDEKWSFGTDDPVEARLKVLGVWLTDKPLPWDDGPPGAATLEVTLDLPESQINAFEIKGVLDDARLFVVPANLVNPRSRMRIGGVDQRSSWFGEQIDDDEDDEEEGDETA